VVHTTDIIIGIDDAALCAQAVETFQVSEGHQ
jgi:hypothetical protein